MAGSKGGNGEAAMLPEPSASGSNNSNAISGSNEADDSQDGSEKTIGRRDSDQSENTDCNLNSPESRHTSSIKGAFKTFFDVSIA